MLWNGESYDFGLSTPPAVTVRVPDVAALGYLLTPSLFNLGQAYVEGKIEIEGRLNEIISVDDALARHTLKPGRFRFARLVRSVNHSKSADQDAVRYHYHLSNAFDQAWLDENIVYPCAYFENGSESLGLAQIKKIDHILTKIQLRPGQTLLDIGCGWSALVMRAAQMFGARCVGITLSRNQYELACERAAQAGLRDQVEIRLQDYREVQGSFGRITSVGMFEHVGARHLVAYFRKMRDLLAGWGIGDEPWQYQYRPGRRGSRLRRRAVH